MSGYTQRLHAAATAHRAHSAEQRPLWVSAWAAGSDPPPPSRSSGEWTMTAHCSDAISYWVAAAKHVSPWPVSRGARALAPPRDQPWPHAALCFRLHAFAIPSSSAFRLFPLHPLLRFPPHTLLAVVFSHPPIRSFARLRQGQRHRSTQEQAVNSCALKLIKVS